MLKKIKVDGINVSDCKYLIVKNNVPKCGCQYALGSKIINDCAIRKDCDFKQGKQKDRWLKDARNSNKELLDIIKRQTLKINFLKKELMHAADENLQQSYDIEKIADYKLRLQQIVAESKKRQEEKTKSKQALYDISNYIKTVCCNVCEDEKECLNCVYKEILDIADGKQPITNLDKIKLLDSGDISDFFDCLMDCYAKGCDGCIIKQLSLSDICLASSKAEIKNFLEKEYKEQKCTD